MSVFSLVLELILVCLLIIAIGYCWRLDQKLRALRSGRDGMIQAAQELQSAVAHAEAAISGLRRSADVAGKELQTRIEEARSAAIQTRREPSDTPLRRRTLG
jgi:hypothetical protein